MGRSAFLLVQMKDRQSWSCGEATRVMLASNSVLRASSPAAPPADSVLRENSEPAVAQWALMVQWGRQPWKQIPAEQTDQSSRAA